MIYIKDMDMPVDCLACRISCKNESYMVIGRPENCPLEEAKTGDLISRENAIEAVCGVVIDEFDVSPTWGYEVAEKALSALPSADAVSREEYERLEALYDAIRIYDSSAEAVQGEWIGYNADKEDWLRTDGTPIFLVCDKCHGTVINNGSAHWNFCPNCGAKMKGGDSE